MGEVADHIEHIAAVAGIDHVGIGPDFTRELAMTLYPIERPIIEGVDLAASVRRSRGACRPAEGR